MFLMNKGKLVSTKLQMSRGNLLCNMLLTLCYTSVIDLLFDNSYCEYKHPLEIGQL